MPRIPIKFEKFTRVNEDTAISKLVEGEIPQLENMVLDNPFGKPAMRGGFPLENNSQTTNAIEKLVDVKSKNGTNYILAGHDTFVSRSVGAAWTNIKTGLQTGFGYFRHIAFGDDLIFTNGSDKPFRLTGNDLGTTTDLEITRPDIDTVIGQLVTTNVGDMDGTSLYLYMLVFVTATGERSSPSNPFTMVVTGAGKPLTTTSTGNQILFSALPVSTDDRVTHKWLFRTEGWSGVSEDGITFFLHTKIDNDITQFVDDKADADLDTSEVPIFVRIPSEAEHIVQSNNRVFLGNFSIPDKNYFEPFVVVLGNGGNQTVIKDGVSATYADQTNGNLSIRDDSPYAGLLSNGDFSSDTVWLKGTGWSISGGTASSNGSQNADSDLTQTITAVDRLLVEGRKYVVKFTVLNRVAGTVVVVVGGTEGTSRNTNATFTETIIAGSGQDFSIRADANFVGDIDNVEFGGGGLTEGKFFQWMYTYVDINGFESDPSYGKAATLSLATNSTDNREITLTYFDQGRIGANNLKSNPELVYRRVYRTEQQNSSFVSKANPFKLVEQLDIRASGAGALFWDYLDDTLDANLGATYAASADVNHKSAIAYSQVDRPAYFLIENKKEVFRDDQDAITGMFDDGNGVLIFKENSIIKLYHTGASQNWYLRKVWTEFGCDEAKSLVKSGDTIYFRYRNRPYAYISGGRPQYIGFGKQNTLDDMTVIDAGANDEWVMFACTQSADHFVLVYDKKINTWYQFNFSTNDLTALLIKKYNDFWVKGNLYIAVGKRIFDYDESVTSDDVSGSADDISTTIKLPRIQIDGTTLSKLRNLAMNFSRTGSINLTLTTEAGSDSPTAIIASVSGLQRLTGFSGKKASDYFEIKFTGGLKELDYLRCDLRPVRRGVGV